MNNTKLTGFFLFYWRPVRLGNRTYRDESRQFGIKYEKVNILIHLRDASKQVLKNNTHRIFQMQQQ